MARELAVSINTVHRWLRADQFPERKPPAGRKKKVAEFAEYLDERWNSGCHNATLLFQEIRARGYRGSRQMVGSFVAAWRSTGSRPLTKKEPQRIAPKHAAILTACAPDKLVPDQQVLLDRLAAQGPDILSLRRIALSFREVLAEKERVRPDALDSNHERLPVRTTRALRLRLAEGPRGRYSRC